MSDLTAPQVSAVIIGRNEGPRLVRCLESVRAARVPQGGLEIIYVDSDSTDGSQDRARALGAKVISVRPERPTAAIGRNAGWREARADYVLFLDGDTILDPEFLMRALPSLDQPQVAVVCGQRRELYPEHTWYNRVLDLDWIGPPGEADSCGGDALMKRAALEAVDGYDEHLIAGEEPDMCTRMRQRGYRILSLDCPMTLHDLAMTGWSQYWRRAVRTGHAYAEVSQRYRATTTPLWYREAQRNLIHAPGLVFLVLLAVMLSLWTGSPLPAVGGAALLAFFVLRSGYRFRWKTASGYTALMYGLHSHLQQLPIFWGQLQFWRNQRSGTSQRLIEYKVPQ
jgi:glycosyltransferase involved in cell wall biosynthesis